MALNGRNQVLLSISCLVVLMGHSCYSQADRLLQGQQLKAWNELLSASGKFKLGFFSPPNTENRYVGIWYNNVDYYLGSAAKQVVWVANRNTPVLDKSASLEIDSTDGNLKIFQSRRNPIALTSVKGARNTSVTLLGSGNLVLLQLNSNGSVERMLWQSFDYPTDTLLPGMKLGFSGQTGQEWYLQSWQNGESPAEGSYILGFYGELFLWSFVPADWGNVNWFLNFYNFSYTRNQQEVYLSYSVNEDVTPFPIIKVEWIGAVRVGSGLLHQIPIKGRDKLMLAVEIIGILGLGYFFIAFSEYSYSIRRAYIKKEENVWLSLIIAVGSIVLVVPFLYYLCCLRIERRGMKPLRNLLRELGYCNCNRQLVIIDFEVIVAATDNFSAANKLGEGGFGSVYKGKFKYGEERAVKKLSKISRQKLNSFIIEAKLIGKLQHANLVRLIGVCLWKEERILVYEYMPNKSLDFYIFDTERKKLLDWKKRFNIMEGIAQGLLYIHKYSLLKVIHLDLKASNILLDDQMNPKISDFGIARIFEVNGLEARTSNIAGTLGYMAPEYRMNGFFSEKADVFSFGVLMLEIISGERINRFHHPQRDVNLVGYAWQLWKEGKGLELTDLTVEESCSCNRVLRCICVGLLCVHDQPNDRPTMSDVVCMLTNDTVPLPEPKQPTFFIPADPEELEAPEIQPVIHCTNDVTISEMEGR